MNFVIGELKVTLRLTKTDVRVLCEGKHVLLENQSIVEVTETITRNFEKVMQYYHSAAQQGVPVNDVRRMAIFIVLDYLYLYNKWQKMYPKMVNLDLGFKDEDFACPGTYDIIAFYCKDHFPGSWMEMVGGMMGKSVDEVRQYEAGRQLYYNK